MSLILFLMFLSLLFGWITGPAIHELAARALERFLRMGFFVALMLMPAIAFAQVPPGAAGASNAGEFLLHLLDALAVPVLLIGLGYLVAHQSGILGFIQGHAAAKDASNAEKLAWNAAGMVERLASSAASKLIETMKNTPGATVTQLLPQFAADAKATLSTDGISTIVDGLGIADNGLASHLQGAIAAAVQTKQLAAAATAGAKAAADVTALPLTDVSKALAAGPK